MCWNSVAFFLIPQKGKGSSDTHYKEAREHSAKGKKPSTTMHRMLMSALCLMQVNCLFRTETQTLFP